MKRINYLIPGLMLMIGLQSCEIIGGIFKAGVWSGILIVVAIVALVIWLIAKAGRKK